MKADKGRPLGGLEATLAIAKVTLLRLSRGKSLWVAIGMALLPLGFAAIRSGEQALTLWRGVMAFWAYFLAILPPVLLASSIGEEMEDRTMTYLWSRPFARWTILAGKFLAIVPVLWLVLTISVVVPFFVAVPDPMAHTDVLTRTIVAVLLATMTAAAITTGIATLVPRYGTVLSLGYLVFIDRTFGWFDISISKLSMTYHTLRVTGVFPEQESMLEAVLWMSGISAFWLAVAAFQVRRIE
jgi:ABC-type transport system involved in multi-copper enzyme maturation permease subunit